MTTKKLYVSSTVQKALLTEVLIPEMATGFWKNHRPADHAAQWADVNIIVTADEKLGPVDFEIPRLYNFVNPDFIKPNEARLVEVACAAKASSNFRSVKKELIELSRIVGGRLTDKNGVPSKANRGTNKPGATVQETVKKAKETVKKAGEKKTAVKKGTTVTKKGGTTVKRTPVVKAAPEVSEGGTDTTVEPLSPTLTAIADAIEPTGEAVANLQAEPVTQHSEGVTDAEIAEAAALVQADEAPKAEVEPAEEAAQTPTNSEKAE